MKFTKYVNETATTTPNETNALKITIDYSVGNGVWFTMYPVELRKEQGYTMESMMAFSGFRARINPMKRANEKKFNKIVTLALPHIEKLVAQYVTECAYPENARMFTGSMFLSNLMENVKTECATA